MNGRGVACARGLGLGMGALIVSLGSVAAAVDGPVYRDPVPDAFMKEWLVLGPIPIAPSGALDEAVVKAAFSSDLLAGGEAQAQPAAGEKTSVAGSDYTWHLVQSAEDAIALDTALAPAEFSTAYASADLDVPQATQALLGIGSDDGIRIWLNGALVHDRWIGRPVQADDDVVPIELRKGRNHLLLKVQNLQGQWGFACRLLGPKGQATRLGLAARNGDAGEIERLLARGVAVEGRDSRGLTAAQTARIQGRTDIVALLARHGADTKTPLPAPESLAEALLTGLFPRDSPGAAVLVARDGKVRLERGFGLADVEGHVPVTAATRFRIGSVTKQFTAAAILKLQEQGKLSVTDHLSKYIPDYPRGGEVTLHHLLTHTSGIHSYTDKPDFVKTVTTPTTPDELIQSFKHDPFDFDPGQRWLYDNSGYVLLGYIVEKVSGQAYGAYLKQAFFEPLGMKDTGVYDAHTDADREAVGYGFEDGRARKAPEWDMSRAGAAGALYSTVGDLYRWNEAVFGGKVLTDASLHAALTPVRLSGEDKAQPKETGYGYGWAVQAMRGVKEVAHDGGLPGFLSYLMRLPAQRFTVVVLTNAAPPLPGIDPAGLARELAQIYLSDTLPPREAPKVVAVDEKTRAAIVGRYDYGGVILTVTTEGERVFAQLTGQPRLEIFPKSETEFFWKDVDAQVTFVRDGSGKVTKAVHHQGGRTFDAPRLP